MDESNNWRKYLKIIFLIFYALSSNWALSQTFDFYKDCRNYFFEKEFESKRIFFKKMDKCEIRVFCRQEEAHVGLNFHYDCKTAGYYSFSYFGWMDSEYLVSLKIKEKDSYLTTVKNKGKFYQSTNVYVVDHKTYGMRLVKTIPNSLWLYLENDTGLTEIPNIKCSKKSSIKIFDKCFVYPLLKGEQKKSK